MLRRRLLMAVLNAVKVYGTMIATVFTKVGTAAQTFAASVAKLIPGAAVTKTFDSKPYDAFVVNAEFDEHAYISTNADGYEAALPDADIAAPVALNLDAYGLEALIPDTPHGVAIAREFDANGYEPTLPDRLALPAVKTGIIPEGFIASEAKSTKSIVCRVKDDAFARGGALGHARQEIANHIAMGAVGASEVRENIKKEIALYTKRDALSADGATGDSDKTIRINSLAKSVAGDSAPMNVKRIFKITSEAAPLDADVHDVSIGIVTTTKPFMRPVASGKVYSKLDNYEGVGVEFAPDCVPPKLVNFGTAVASSPSINADAVATSVASKNHYGVNTGVNTHPEKYAVNTTDIHKAHSMIITFAPTAKAFTWLDPILTDGSLYIKQAYGINPNENILEVI